MNVMMGFVLFFVFSFAVSCGCHSGGCGCGQWSGGCGQWSGGCGWFLKFLRWILFIYFNEFFILF